MIDIKIADGTGSKQGVKVNKNNALKVYQSLPSVPDSGTPNIYRYLQGKLGSSGLNSGTTSMNVNGSSTAQEFYVAANEYYDTYIMGISILIADASIVHNEFGTVSPLTIGWDLKIKESGVVTYLIEKAKTGGQVIAQSGFAWPYGNSGTTWELTNWTASGDAQTIFLPISSYIPTGIRLGRGSTDKIISVINDNLLDLDEFTVTVHGYTHHDILTEGA